MPFMKTIVCAVVLLGATSPGYERPSVGQERASGRSERQAYKEWYDVFKERNLPQCIKLGEAYVQEYPGGIDTDFVRDTIGLVRISLDKEKIAEARELRRLVQASLRQDAGELESRLKRALCGEGDLNARTSNGQTLLMFAAAAADAESVNALLRKGAGLDLTEETHGWTVLVYAIWSGDLRTIETVLEYYPDANIKDKNGRTALDHAILSADLEVILLIEGRPMRGVDDAIGPGPGRSRRQY